MRYMRQRRPFPELIHIHNCPRAAVGWRSLGSRPLQRHRSGEPDGTHETDGFARGAKAGPVASAVRQEAGRWTTEPAGDWNERGRDGSSPKGLRFRGRYYQPD